MENNVLTSRRTNYSRNFILLCLDSFIFSFVLSIFSYVTVFPYYVSKLSDKNIIISLIPATMFIGTNGFQIFSCILSVKSKNEKGLYFKIIILQRAGFLLIFLSSYLLKYLSPIASLIFFIAAFGIFTITNGYAQPVWTSLVTKLIYKKRGKFFGINYMCGSFAGILGAYITKKFLQSFSYPDNFTYLYLTGLIISFISFIFIALLKGNTSSIGDTDINIKNLFPEVKKIIEKNKAYRKFLTGRSLIAIGEIASSFYILKANSVLQNNGKCVGTLTMVMLVSQALFSLMWGYIGDIKGYWFTLRSCAVLGIAANVLAIFSRNIILFYIVFILVGAILNGIIISNVNLSINYSTKELLPVFVALTNLIIMPFTGLGPILAGYLADSFTLNIVFYISLTGYLSGFIYSLFIKQNN